MSTARQIGARVRAYFLAKWPHANDSTKLREDLGLLPEQILDIGTELAETLGCNPTRTQILACKDIKALIDLLVTTRRAVRKKPPSILSLSETTVKRRKKASKKRSR